MKRCDFHSFKLSCTREVRAHDVDHVTSMPRRIVTMVQTSADTLTRMRRILALLPRRSILMETRSVSASSPQLGLKPGDKRPRLESPRPPKRGKKKKRTLAESGSSDDVISRDVGALLGKELMEKAEAEGIEWESPFGFREEVDLTVSSISSTGMSYSKVCVRGPLLLNYSSISDLFGQVRDLPSHRRRKAHGSSSFHSSCQERSFARAFTGMQRCTLSQTSSVSRCRIPS